MAEVMFKAAFLNAIFPRLVPFLSKLPGMVMRETFTPTNIGLTGLFSLTGGAGVPHPASNTIRGV